MVLGYILILSPIYRSQSTEQKKNYSSSIEVVVVVRINNVEIQTKTNSTVTTIGRYVVSFNKSGQLNLKIFTIDLHEVSSAYKLDWKVPFKAKLKNYNSTTRM